MVVVLLFRLSIHRIRRFVGDASLGIIVGLLRSLEVRSNPCWIVGDGRGKLVGDGVRSCLDFGAARSYLHLPTRTWPKSQKARTWTETHYVSVPGQEYLSGITWMVKVGRTLLSLQVVYLGQAPNVEGEGAAGSDLRCSLAGVGCWRGHLGTCLPRLT